MDRSDQTRPVISRQGTQIRTAREAMETSDRQFDSDLVGFGWRCDAGNEESVQRREDGDVLSVSFSVLGRLRPRNRWGRRELGIVRAGTQELREQGRSPRQVKVGHI